MDLGRLVVQFAQPIRYIYLGEQDRLRHASGPVQHQLRYIYFASQILPF